MKVLQETELQNSFLKSERSSQHKQNTKLFKTEKMVFQFVYGYLCHSILNLSLEDTLKFSQAHNIVFVFQGYPWQQIHSSLLQEETLETYGFDMLQISQRICCFPSPKTLEFRWQFWAQSNKRLHSELYGYDL